MTRLARRPAGAQPGQATYRQVEQRLTRHVGDRISNPLVRNAVRIALAHAFAVSAGNEHQAANLLRRYERTIGKLGYDPLA